MSIFEFACNKGFRHCSAVKLQRLWILCQDFWFEFIYKYIQVSETEGSRCLFPQTATFNWGYTNIYCKSSQEIEMEKIQRYKISQHKYFAVSKRY